MRRTSALCLSFFFVATASLSLGKMPKPFSADVRYVYTTGETRTGKLFFSRGDTRIELNMKQRPTLIAPAKSQIGYLLLNARIREAVNLTPEREYWHPYDPKNPCANIDPSTNRFHPVECQNEGVDTVEGRRLVKWQLRAPKELNDYAKAEAMRREERVKQGLERPHPAWIRIWVDEATGITMKIQTEHGDIMELSSVRFGKQHKALFKVPQAADLPPDVEHPDVLKGPIFAGFDR